MQLSCINIQSILINEPTNIACRQSCELERAPTRSDIEMELKQRRDDAARKAGKSHVSDGSRGGAKADVGSPSSRVSHMGEDRGLLARMEGLEESMKLIMAALNIGGKENRKNTNEDIGAGAGYNLTGNLVNESSDVEPIIVCTQTYAMEDEVFMKVS